MRNINLNFVIKTLNNGAMVQVTLVNIRFYLDSRSNQDLDVNPEPMLKNMSSSNTVFVINVFPYCYIKV
jgi:hypothetical protein